MERIFNPDLFVIEDNDAKLLRDAIEVYSKNIKIVEENVNEFTDVMQNVRSRLPENDTEVIALINRALGTKVRPLREKIEQYKADIARFKETYESMPKGNSPLTDAEIEQLESLEQSIETCLSAIEDMEENIDARGL